MSRRPKVKLPDVPPVPAGHKRKWMWCRKCDEISYLSLATFIDGHFGTDSDGGFLLSSLPVT